MRKGENNTIMSSVWRFVTVICRFVKESDPVLREPCLVCSILVFPPCQLSVQILFFPWHQWRQRSNLFLQSWPSEIYHWQPWQAWVSQYPVLNTLKPPIRHNLKFPNSNTMHYNACKTLLFLFHCSRYLHHFPYKIYIYT